MTASKVFYQIKIQAKDMRPSIYRTILVPSDNTFFTLHQYIQEVFDLLGYHLWEFQIGRRYEGGKIAVPIPKEEVLFFDEQPEFDAKKTKIFQILKAEKDNLHYWYDFGDDWWFDVTLQKIIPAKELNSKIDPKNTPLLLKAKGPMLLENCGGNRGFAEILFFYNELKKGRRFTKKEQEEMEHVICGVVDDPKESEYGSWEEEYMDIIDMRFETDWKDFTFSDGDKNKW